MLSLLPLLLFAAAPTPSRVRLVYDASGTGCPAKARLMGAVMARLGYEPFSDDSNETVDVQLRRSGSSLSALVVRSDAEGETGRRELTSPTSDCSELFRALELAVATAIDPRAGLARPLPPAVPAPPQAPAPPRLASDKEPVVPTSFQLGLGPTGSLGTGPSAAFGFMLLGGLQRGSFELNLGGRIELPAGLALTHGTLNTQAVVGELSACLAVSAMRACALGELGVLRVTSAGLTPAALQTAMLADVGLRLGLHLRVHEHLALRPLLDVAAALARTSILADGREVWVTSPVRGTLGVLFLITSDR